MDSTAAIIAVVTGMFTGITGIVIAFITYRGAASKTELESLRATILTQRNELDALQKERKEEKIEYKERIGGLEKSRDDLWKDNEELRKCITTLEDENSVLNGNYNRIQREREQTTLERDNLKAQVIKMQVEIDKIPALQRENEMIRQMVKDLGGKPPTGELKRIG